MNLVRYDPDVLLTKYRSIRTSVPVDVFYTKPKFRKAMELWCAAQFARGYDQNVGRCTVLIPEGKKELYFDFRLEVGQQNRDFQLTEVQAAGRRRGDEYRKGSPESRATVADWDRGERLGGEWLAQAIKRKHEHYGGDVANLDLLVYVNFLATEC